MPSTTCTGNVKACAGGQRDTASDRQQLDMRAAGLRAAFAEQRHQLHQAAGTGKARQAADMHLRRERGAHIFRLFAEKGGLAFRVPFNAADPVNTPNTLDVENPKVLAALVDSVKQLRTLKIPMNATLAQVQTEPRTGGERIPIHGGPGPEGIFNVITPVDLKPELGWTKIRHGSSWIM
eukprot:gene5000-6783_t